MLNRVYVLISTHKLDGHREIEGVISNFNTAMKFASISNETLHYSFKESELDDPELLNRIAKEGENK